MEQGLRYSLNFMLDADEINRNAREATRNLLQRLCKKLQTTNDLRKTLLQFVRDADSHFSVPLSGDILERPASGTIDAISRLFRGRLLHCPRRVPARRSIEHCMACWR
jgi:hypothetical protein